MKRCQECQSPFAQETPDGDLCLLCQDIAHSKKHPVPLPSNPAMLEDLAKAGYQPAQIQLEIADVDTIPPGKPVAQLLDTLVWGYVIRICSIAPADEKRLHAVYQRFLTTIQSWPGSAFHLIYGGGVITATQGRRFVSLSGFSKSASASLWAYFKERLTTKPDDEPADQEELLLPLFEIRNNEFLATVTWDCHEPESSRRKAFAILEGARKKLDSLPPDLKEAVMVVWQRQEKKIFVTIGHSIIAEIDTPDAFIAEVVWDSLEQHHRKKPARSGS